MPAAFANETCFLKLETSYSTPMLLIADGGSTKADWKFLEKDGNSFIVTTTGFNPNYDAPDRISAIASEELAMALHGKFPQTIHYYGAGCIGLPTPILSNRTFSLS